MTEKTVTLRKGEGRAFWLLNGLYEIKVSSEESGGALTVMEITMPEGGGPPMHTHSCDESVYVLDGTVRFHSDGTTFEAGPGSFVHFPRGTEERPEPVGGTARILITYVPSGMDLFFAEAGVEAPNHDLPPFDPEPPDFARIAAVAARHGLQFVGP